MTMLSQDIFKAFGSNWKWASISRSGTARVHTVQPTFAADGVVCYSMKENTVERCPVFNLALGCGSHIIDRTDFSNGPQYPTDRFGMSLVPAAPQMPTQQMPAPLPARGYCTAKDCFNEKAVGWNLCETHCPPPPAPQTRLTTDEAENGELWKFAKANENFVRVYISGDVYFGETDNPPARQATDVVVDGVTHVIERTRSQPELAPPEAGKPYVAVPEAPLPKSYPSAPHTVAIVDHGGVTQYGGHTFVWYDEAAQVAGAASTLDEAIRQQQAYRDWLNLTTVPEVVDVIAALDKAKERAKKLTAIYVQDGTCSRQALSELQYMAIFGE